MFLNFWKVWFYHPLCVWKDHKSINPVWTSILHRRFVLLKFWLFDLLKVQKCQKKAENGPKCRKHPIITVFGSQTLFLKLLKKKKGLIIGCRHKKAQNNITHHQQSYHYPTKHAITTCYGTKVWIYTFWMGFVCFLKILMFHRIFHSGISPKSFWRGHFLNFLPGCGTSEFSLCLGRTWLEGELKIYLFIMGECNFETLIFFFRKSKIFSSFHVFLAIIDLIFSFLLFSDSSGFIFFTSDHLQGDLQGIAF